MSGVFSRGKQSWAISDRSGMAFPYREMVKEWNGFLVHYSEYEPKQPQLDPRFHGGDPQALRNARPQPAAKTSLILLGDNPFTTVKAAVVSYVNVFSPDHQRKNLSTVRLRGAPLATSAGPGGSDPADNRNMQQFATIPTLDGISNLSNSAGFTIGLGKIDSTSTVTTAPGTLTSPENWFYFDPGQIATVGDINGGGSNNSAGPVTLEVVNG
jgi:hypothetical protein|tara:strand:+ start:470 stop:1105 length:636 start_codon:yes stop_codon:yes gene_type:complete